MMDQTSALSEEIHISDYWRVIRSRKAVILTFFVSVVFFVTLLSFLMPPVYRSTVTILVDLESSNVLATSGDSVSMQSPNYYAYKEYFQSQKEIIVSREILKRVFEELALAKDKEYATAKDPIEAFKKTVSVNPVRDTRLMGLSVENKDPQKAADIANRIAQLYVERNLAYISQSEILNLHKNEYLKLQARLQEDSKIYKDKHPRMIRLREEIDSLVRRIQQEKENPLSTESNINYSVLSGLKANNITIQDKAEAAKDPIRPKKRLNILMAIALGLFGGLALAFMLEYLDDSIKNIEDLQRLASWPFLGYIPQIPTEKKGEAPIVRDTFVNDHPKSPVSEAYRAVRTSIQFLHRDDRPVRVLMTTSPGAGEGKSMTVCNMAIALAQSGKNVLLVDADMRKSRLHKVFGVNTDQGFSGYLAEMATFEQAVKPTKIKGLSLAPCGVHPPNPAELLAGKRLKDFIEAARAKFDYVLFDTPPIIVVTDAAIIAQHVDEVVLVLESGRTGRRVIPRIAQILKESRASGIGVLINKIAPTNSSYYYYYSSYYGKKA